MSLLLDTHAYLWSLAGELSPELTAEVADPNAVVLLSAVSVWEIAIKRAAGKLSFEGSIAAHARLDGFDTLAISVEHAERAGALPLHHRDPFDRMLIAQAQAERLTIVTHDRAFDLYDVDVLRC